MADHLAAHPDDPDRDAMLARSAAWRDRYLAGGREAFGFGLTLLRKPRDAQASGSKEAAR